MRVYMRMVEFDEVIDSIYVHIDWSIWNAVLAYRNKDSDRAT